MISPQLALQGAIDRILRADPAVGLLVGQRIYDVVPASAAFPYVTFGPSQETTRDADCFDGADVFQQVDVWSREPGFVQCKRIEVAIAAALHGASATADGLTFDIELRFTDTMRAADGLTSHGVLSFRAEIYQLET